MRPGKRKALKNAGQMGELLDQAEKLKAAIRAKVEHLFRVIKRHFGYIRTRYRGLKKNAAQIATLCALSNLWMARQDLTTVWACVRLKWAKNAQARHQTPTKSRKRGSHPARGALKPGE